MLGCFRYHPDKTANDPVAADMFKEVTFSYNILSDPEKRRQYDTAGFEVRFDCVRQDLCFLSFCVIVDMMLLVEFKIRFLSLEIMLFSGDFLHV